MVEQIIKQDPDKTKTAKLKRGIRTLKEIAHFVRCFNTITELKGKVEDDVWITPNAMLEMRQGREQDKALLMACMMCGCLEETSEQANQTFMTEIKKECQRKKLNQKIEKLMEIEEGRELKEDESQDEYDDENPTMPDQNEDLSSEQRKNTTIADRVFVCIGNHDD